MQEWVKLADVWIEVFDEADAELVARQEYLIESRPQLTLQTRKKQCDGLQGRAGLDLE
jgi:hypothetical protein